MASQNSNDTQSKCIQDSTPLNTYNTHPTDSQARIPINKYKCFDFKSYNLDLSEYDLEPETLKKLCIKIDQVNKLRQAYSIIEEQMKIIASVMPYSAPLTTLKIRDLEDIKEWIRFQKLLVDNSGLTHISSSSISIENGIQIKKHRNWDLRRINAENMRPQDQNIQTDEVDIAHERCDDKNQNQTQQMQNFNNQTVQNQTLRTNTVVVIDPPILHGTLNKIKEIRDKYTEAELRQDCGDAEIEGGSEYECYARFRRHISGLVRAWQKSLSSPSDDRNNDDLEYYTQMVEHILDNAEEDDLTRKLLAKAYRTVTASRYFRGLFHKTKKLDKRQGNGEGNSEKQRPESHQNGQRNMQRQFNNSQNKSAYGRQNRQQGARQIYQNRQQNNRPYGHDNNSQDEPRPQQTQHAQEANLQSDVRNDRQQLQPTQEAKNLLKGLLTKMLADL